MPNDNTKKQQQVQQNKKRLLLALEESLGVVTSACRACNLDRTTFYRYVNEDPTFAKEVKGLEDVALDFAENCLHQQIREGVPASTIFYLKTKGKNRGYVERQEVVSALDLELTRLKAGIEARAKAKGINYEAELKYYLEYYAVDVKPEMRTQLASELAM